MGRSPLQAVRQDLPRETYTSLGNAECGGSPSGITWVASLLLATANQNLSLQSAHLQPYRCTSQRQISIRGRDQQQSFAAKCTHMAAGAHFAAKLHFRSCTNGRYSFATTKSAGPLVLLQLKKKGRSNFPAAEATRSVSVSGLLFVAEANIYRCQFHHRKADFVAAKLLPVVAAAKLKLLLQSAHLQVQKQICAKFSNKPHIQLKLPVSRFVKFFFNTDLQCKRAFILRGGKTAFCSCKS